MTLDACPSVAEHAGWRTCVKMVSTRHSAFSYMTTMTHKHFIAVDIGASSGRTVIGRFDGQRLALEEAHRFENGPVRVGDHLHWDVLRQWTHIQEGLRAAGQLCGSDVVSVGVDTWGVDFGLLGPGDELLANPYHYRDRRTDGVLDRAFAVASREEIFAATGLQFMPFNTLFQLIALRESGSATLDAARSLLLMPDLFHWLLTGVQGNEFTNATTTQFLDPRTRTWAVGLLERFGLPTKMLGPIMPPGTSLGPLLPAVALETGLGGARVVLPGTHDTASAVMAVPAASTPGAKPDWCYLSSGTWSLMGAEVSAPVISDRCRELNFTNEGGVGGTIRLLKNITGLWLLQECRRVWAAEGQTMGWEELNRLAAAAPSRQAWIDPDDPVFLAPDDMPEAIRGYCRRTGQAPLSDRGAVLRCALESLAMKYRRVLGWLEELVGGRLHTIHIVGGGVQNRQLCQATADACGRVVFAGPAEATATGNVMMQATACGAVGSLTEAREVIRRSLAVETYEPRETPAWDEAFARFTQAVGRAR